MQLVPCRLSFHESCLVFTHTLPVMQFTMPFQHLCEYLKPHRQQTDAAIVSAYQFVLLLMQRYQFTWSLHISGIDSLLQISLTSDTNQLITGSPAASSISTSTKSVPGALFFFSLLATSHISSSGGSSNSNSSPSTSSRGRSGSSLFNKFSKYSDHRSSISSFRTSLSFPVLDHCQSLLVTL